MEDRLPHGRAGGGLSASEPAEPLHPVGRDAGRMDAFILANTALSVPPHVPEIRLRLASEAFGLWQRTEEELATLGLPPPFWAFAWAGGQALARYLLDNPGVVRGREVIDVGTGSGLAAIAAARAGARRVHACDTDAFAQRAASLNAAVNGAAITVCGEDVLARSPFDPASPFATILGAGPTVVLLGDLFYEPALARGMRNLAERLCARGHGVFVGDPSRAYLPRDGVLHELAVYEVPVTRALEDAEVRRSAVYAFRHKDFA